MLKGHGRGRTREFKFVVYRLQRSCSLAFCSSSSIEVDAMVECEVAGWMQMLRGINKHAPGKADDECKRSFKLKCSAKKTSRTQPSKRDTGQG